MDNLRILILAGGSSSRMGTAKHLLQLPDGRPLYARLAQVLTSALPHRPSAITISLAPNSSLDDSLQEDKVSIDFGNAKTKMKFKRVLDQAGEDIGPAAGLLAAHRSDPSATWLVAACDFPLLQVETVQQLVQSYESPVTCFTNAEGFCEPLLAIWGPEGLNTLAQNVQRGILGPSRAVKQLGGKLIAPSEEWWLTNANTRQEWEAALASAHITHVDVPGM